MLNNCVFMGRLTRDPEVKITPSGKAVANFTIAVDRNTSVKATDFIPCVAWEKTAELIGHKFAKGSLIALEGSMQGREYQAQDGTKRRVLELLVHRMHFTGEGWGERGAKAQIDQLPAGVEVMDGDDEDLPF
jgi:single-strand DNA-binding protein